MLNVDPNEIIDYDDEDDFEDANEGDEMSIGAEAVSQDNQMRKLAQQIILDQPEERINLPCLRDPRIKSSAIWSIFKDLVGKDITKYSLPVLVNEPLSIL